MLIKNFNEFHNQIIVLTIKKGCSPVLVLKNDNQLTQDNPKLNILLDMAKDAADHRLYITIFKFIPSSQKMSIQIKKKFYLNFDKPMSYNNHSNYILRIDITCSVSFRLGKML